MASKQRCSMCGCKLVKGKIIKDGEFSFCDLDCKTWYYKTYLERKE